MEIITYDQQQIFLPLLATLLLGFIIWLIMFATRFKVIAANNINASERCCHR